MKGGKKILFVSFFTSRRNRNDESRESSSTSVNKVKNLYGGSLKFTSLPEALHCIDLADSSIRNLTLLPPACGDQDVPTDEEDDFDDTTGLPTEVAGELEVNFNDEISSDDEDDGVTNMKARRMSLRKRKIVCCGESHKNNDAESDENHSDEDYIVSKPVKKQQKKGASSKLVGIGSTKGGKKQTSKKDQQVDKSKKWKQVGQLLQPLKKNGVINHHPKVEEIEDKTPFETWCCLFTDEMFDMLLCQTQLYANRDKGDHDFHMLRSELYQFIGILIFSGYHKVPKERDYWSSQLDLHVFYCRCDDTK